MSARLVLESDMCYSRYLRLVHVDSSFLVLNGNGKGIRVVLISGLN
nr:MAG TPA: hypothetical protein [Caudoviricetes sp.]